ncbi:fibrous sheath CABYR-binding protein-like isoform X3 [Cataglyphis hispanica]|nr:fibrous sheath CABYR-binding protein-like isoform X3 [Cataglyphis hispanica]XP_050462546.1 fibrous sheath CABYR-binding protein-like isoform X3 [Cataglyphis hispanica]
MERLYAVPSEKLRVWMVWLNGVGEIADEWHKWLRVHIDLITERLQPGANSVPGGSTKIESVTNAKSEEILDNAIPTEKEERDVSSDALNEKSEIIEDETTNDISSASKAPLEERVDESPEAMANESSANQVSSTSQAHNNPTTDSAGRRTGEDGEEESAMTGASETAKETMPVWPIGTSSQTPLTRCPIERKADQMETIPSFKMPQEEMERIEFLKNFPHQATLYGSYYKHWIETADQAVKEIAGRTVVTTAEFRATDDVESRLDEATLQPSQYSMKQPESAVAQPIEETTTATAEMPMLSQIDSPTKDALEDSVKATTTLSDDQSEVVEPPTEEIAGIEAESPSAELDAAESPSAEVDAAESPSAELDAVESPSAEPDALSPSVEPDVTARATPQPETTPQMSPTMESIVSKPSSEIVASTLSVEEAVAKREAAEKLIRDMARADENIPYFFYLKAEPDIDIAIRYNDEKVIPPDLDRESISVNRKRLYFNLTDKLGRE